MNKVGTNYDFIQRKINVMFLAMGLGAAIGSGIIHFLAMDIGVAIGSSILGFVAGLVIGIASGYAYWGKPHDE